MFPPLIQKSERQEQKEDKNINIKHRNHYIKLDQENKSFMDSINSGKISKRKFSHQTRNRVTEFTNK